jgi:hydroxypyruvate isomerase
VKITRRSVLATGAAAAGAVAMAPVVARSNAPRFSLGFAPHEGSFKSRGSRLEQIAYAADQGFTAWEDNEAAGRPVEEQVAMARALQQRGMTMGVFVASMPKWAQSRPVLGANDDGDRTAFLADIRASIDVAKRLNAKWMTVVPGFLDPRVPIEIQTGRVIDTMRRAADIVASHGLVMVMEPLNTIVDHPGVFLQTVPQGYAVARGVDSPAVKLLAGRKEPGTGEINYSNIVRWLRAKQFAGVIGMEHGNSIEGRAGEERLLAAYRAIDAA